MFLLDTNVLSEVRKAGDGRADANVVAWFSSVEASALYVSAVTLMEIELGILRVERRDPGQGARLRAWMDSRVLPEFQGRTLAVDATVALRCARLHVPDPRPERDAFLAATALVHGLTLVTRNVADFQGSRVEIVNPWERISHVEEAGC
ncbi:type II toxin-antitoxin system VapC family toxin ['Planchonia careya' phytoplasma]|nr:type II toxin-antitoxin system VapC family toxin ['Planchonia careya' phytoplasma]